MTIIIIIFTSYMYKYEVKSNIVCVYIKYC